MMAPSESSPNWVEIISDSRIAGSKRYRQLYVEPKQVEYFYEYLKQLFVFRATSFVDKWHLGKIEQWPSSRFTCILQDHLCDRNGSELALWKRVYQEVKDCIQSLAAMYDGCPLGCSQVLGGFQYFLLPSKIQDRISRYILGSGSFGQLVVGDYHPDQIPPTAIRRTQYEIWMEDESRRTTTYSVTSRNPKIGPGTLNLWQTCSGLHRRMMRSLYGERIIFIGTVESALAFLHDRWSGRRWLSELELNYHFRPSRSYLAERDESEILMQSRRDPWRRLCNFLVHKCTLLDIKLIVDKAFWRVLPWKGPLDDIMLHPNKREPVIEDDWGFGPPDTRYKDNERKPTEFLERIAKIGGAPESFRLVIQGARTDEQEDFEEELEQRIKLLMSRREYIADSADKECGCRGRELKESCIWQQEDRKKRQLEKYKKWKSRRWY